MAVDRSISHALEQAMRDNVRAYLEARPQSLGQIDLAKCPPIALVDGIPPLPGESAIAYCRRLEAMFAGAEPAEAGP